MGKQGEEEMKGKKRTLLRAVVIFEMGETFQSILVEHPTLR